jgi:hypothetical protein
MKLDYTLPFCSQPFPGVHDRYSVAANALHSPRQLAETKKEIACYADAGSRGLVCSWGPRALFEIARPKSE